MDCPLNSINSIINQRNLEPITVRIGQDTSLAKGKPTMYIPREPNVCDLHVFGLWEKTGGLQCKLWEFGTQHIEVKDICSSKVKARKWTTYKIHSSRTTSGLEKHNAMEHMFRVNCFYQYDFEHIG